MQKSIFYKYFTIIASILLLCFVILGSILLVFTKNQWREDKEELLSNNVHTISDFSASTLVSGKGFRGELDSTVKVISRIIGADIYVADVSGNCYLCSDEETDCRHKTNVIDKKYMNRALSGDNSYSGTMGGIYQSACYTVSTPIVVENSAVGAVFASTPLEGASVAVSQMFKMLLICSLLILMLAFIAVYIISSQMTRPLRQMAQAAKKMENGEFVQIQSTGRNDEIGALVEAFNRMSKSLSQLEEMRRSFISSVSHELKTPMTTISGFVDGMLDGTIPKESYPKYMRIVSDETKRLSRLVNSMLQLSRLENDNVKLNRSTFNVSDLLLRIMLSFEKRIEDKKIELRGLEDTEKIMLFSDSDLIYQVLYNLVENAIKFTPESGYIEVRVSEDKQNNVEIAIKNSGEGLTSVELSRIFERFYKTDRSRSNDKTGMGFGLYIVKMIVGLHGGQITAESVLNEYTKFTVLLPNDVQNPAQIVVNEAKSDKRFRPTGHKYSSQENKTYDAEIIESDENEKGDSDK